MSLDDPELSAQIQRHATRHVAPDALRAGIRAQVTLAEAGRAPSADTAARGWRRWWMGSSGPVAAAGFALGVVLTVAILPVLPPWGSDGSTEAVLVADHVRALRSGPLTEVESSDRHTVKPWFQGKLDYAPPVFDLAAEGFPLQGGRIEHLHGNAIATLVYTKNRHVIQVFVWPAAAPEVLTHRVHRGFNLLHWADGSMQYWAVSDLEHVEIQRFAQIWQVRSAAP